MIYVIKSLKKSSHRYFFETFGGSNLIIFGMPGEAIKLGAAQKLPPSKKSPNPLQILKKSSYEDSIAYLHQFFKNPRACRFELRFNLIRIKRMHIVVVVENPPAVAVSDPGDIMSSLGSTYVGKERG